MTENATHATETLHKSSGLDAGNKVTQPIIARRRARNKRQGEFTAQKHKQHSRGKFTGRISKMASWNGNTSSPWRGFAPLQSESALFSLFSAQENTSVRSMQRLLQLYNSISSAPAGFSHRLRRDRKLRQTLTTDSRPLLTRLRTRGTDQFTMLQENQPVRPMCR